MSVLKVWDGTQYVSIGLASSGSTGLVSVQKFEASGTWTRPAGITKVLVEVVGGGGGADNSTLGRGGAGGGGFSKRWIVAPGTAETVTIGAGGALQTNGGQSSFGTWAFGSGGLTPTSGAIGANGGIGSAGDLNITGERGGDTTACAGKGGSSPMGYGFGGAGKASGDGGSMGQGYGGGASGALAAVGAGTGSQGYIIVWEYA